MKKVIKNIIDFLAWFIVYTGEIIFAIILILGVVITLYITIKTAFFTPVNIYVIYIRWILGIITWAILFKWAKTYNDNYTKRRLRK